MKFNINAKNTSIIIEIYERIFFFYLSHTEFIKRYKMGQKFMLKFLWLYQLLGSLHKKKSVFCVTSVFVQCSTGLIRN